MEKNTNELHIPVMLQRCLEWLGPAIEAGSGYVIDATLGMGGHSEAILAEFPNARVIGFDRDPQAIGLAVERLAGFADRFTAVQDTYDQIADHLQTLRIDKVSAVLFDLGVSSLQLDERDRGFAYAQDAPLDMRMTQGVGETASDLLNRLSESELTRIFREFGEERYASRIAREICAIRVTNPILRSSQLNELVTRVVPQVPGKQTGHPAKRVYQALRVAVNEEFEILEAALPQAIAALEPGGRVAVMSYHSIEDAIVKRAFQQAATSSTPADFPVEIPGTGPILKVLTRGVERATERELAVNPRSASARLRVAEKLEAR